MIKLNASYAKKVPAAGEYTSQSYHCSMEVELSDALEPQQLRDRIHQTFATVRDAVEAELHGGAKVEPERTPLRVLREEEPRSTPTGGKATNRQVKYLLDLAKAQGLGLSEVNARVQKQFRVGSVYALDRKSASTLVDELKAAA